MNVRHAKLRDIEGIKKVAEAVRYKPEDPKQKSSIVYVLTPEEYAQRIRDSRFCYVGEDEGIARGFLICLDDDILGSMSQRKLFHHDGILPFLSQQQRPYVFGETIAVNPDYTRRRVGRLMMEALFKDMKNAGIHNMHVLIRHSPDRNDNSIDFCRSFGVDYQGKEVVNSDKKFVWGVYSLRGIAH
jgi:ribosomal protein S18 acetylase RimI-like enzyme